MGIGSMVQQESGSQLVREQSAILKVGVHIRTRSTLFLSLGKPPVALLLHHAESLRLTPCQLVSSKF